MGFFIAAGAVAFLAIVLLITGIALVRQAESFNKNVRPGKAEIVGYDRTNQSDWYTLMVKIPELNDGNLYSCTARRIDISQYPKGKTIDVLYAPKKTMGISIVEVHLAENPPVDSSKLGLGFKRVAYALLVIGGILVITGIISLIA